MPRVHFDNDGIVQEASAGTALPQVAQEGGASLPFGCRAGTCGACVLTVVAGEEGLDLPGFVEDDTMHVLGVHGEGRRLGCQIILRDGDIKVRW